MRAATAHAALAVVVACGDPDLVTDAGPRDAPRSDAGADGRPPDAARDDAGAEVVNAGCALPCGGACCASGHECVAGACSPAEWPNEPAGFRALADRPWDSVDGDGWSYLRRAASRDADVFMDGTAPFSPSNVLRMIFTPDMGRDQEPGVHWMALPRVREVYAAWWMKVSANWASSPAGGGKITFLWAPDGEGQVYTGLFDAEEPHVIAVNTEWSPYGQRIWRPNATETPIHYDRWYRIEWYCRWASSPTAADGVMRWWVDGELNGDHADVRYPDGGFVQFEFAPTLQSSPPEDQFMFVDHTRVSTP